MKRGMLGIGVLVLLFAGSLWGMNRVRQQLAPVVFRMEQAAEAAEHENFEKTAALTEKARAAWDGYRLKFSGLSHQDGVRTIDSLFDQVLVYARSREPAHCSETCVILRNHLRALLEDQLLCLQNLL